MHSLEEVTEALYGTILRRKARPAEIAWVEERIASGADAADIAVALANSKEAQKYRTPLFVPPGHFYSPIVNPHSLQTQFASDHQDLRPLAGVTLDLDRMTSFWIAHLRQHCTAAPFLDAPSASFRYHYDNPTYAYGDGTILHGMLMHLKPSRVIEVGSGWSSACILDTIIGIADLPSQLTFVEPHPELLRSIMWPGDEDRARVLPTEVQNMPVAEFELLADRDVLFIDSTHVLKTGSDVVYELCEILPRLKAGVVVHFHDIFYPFEYGRRWAIEENRSWNEIYALRCFLAFNSAFEVIFFNDMFARFRRPLIRQDCPRILKNTGGGIWLRRRS